MRNNKVKKYGRINVFDPSFLLQTSSTKKIRKKKYLIPVYYDSLEIAATTGTFNIKINIISIVCNFIFNILDLVGTLWYKTCFKHVHIYVNRKYLWP